MKFLEKKVQELEEADLGKEVEGMMEASDVPLGSLDTKKDSILNVRVEKIERVRLKPITPIVNPGSLLGSTEEVGDDDPNGLFSAPKAFGRGAIGMVDGSLEEVRLGLEDPRTSNVESLFEVSRRMKKTLLVVGDYIEIIKTTLVSSGQDADNDTTKRNVQYDITHYVDVLDSDSMYRLPTTLFGPEDENDIWNQHVLSVEELNLREIVERYNKGTLEEVLYPLKVVS